PALHPLADLGRLGEGGVDRPAPLTLLPRPAQRRRALHPVHVPHRSAARVRRVQALALQAAPPPRRRSPVRELHLALEAGRAREVRPEADGAPRVTTYDNGQRALVKDANRRLRGKVASPTKGPAT